MFQGKILDVERSKGGFNLGRVKLSGLNSDAGSEAVVHFQNENLIAEKDGQVIAMTPDLICMVDLETLTPVTTESLKYGKRVQVMGLKANAAWRTKRYRNSGSSVFRLRNGLSTTRKLSSEGGQINV